MKKMILWFLVAVFLVSLTFVGTACKEEAVESVAGETSEEAVEETTEEPAEEVTEEHEPVTIMYWSKEGDEPSVVVWNELIAEFEEMYPWITVDLQIINDIDNKLVTVAAAGGDIDVFEPNVNTTNSFMAEGLLQPQNEWVDKLGGSEIYINNDAAIDEEGNVLAVPYATGGFVWYIRKDKLAEKGIAEPNELVSWDEFLTLAQQLTDENMYGIGFPMKQDLSTYFFFSQFAWSNGIDYFDKDFNITFNNPRMVEALKYYTDLAAYAPEDITEWSWAECIDYFLAERVAIAPYAGRMVARIYADKPELKDKIMAIRTPYNPNFMSVGIKDINQRAVYANTKHPEECLLFMEWLHKPENIVRFLITVPPHMLPNTPAEDAIFQQQSVPEIEENPEIVQVILNARENAFTQANMVGGIDFENKTVTVTGIINPYADIVMDGSTIGGTLQKIFLMGMDPQAAADEGQAELDIRLEEMMKEQQ